MNIYRVEVNTATSVDGQGYRTGYALTIKRNGQVVTTFFAESTEQLLDKVEQDIFDTTEPDLEAHEAYEYLIEVARRNYNPKSVTFAVEMSK